ncbi:MAG: ribosomal-processing cysteine protease Prp [Firmicutes bacterium]|nr:ribosomal-processing cysteine protease Prp [Bacillota bacterium]
MIKAAIFFNKQGLAVGFTVKCHGSPIVCSAVSALVINTVNSIQKLTPVTDEDYHCKWNDSGGFVKFALKRSGLRNTGAGLLLDALVLGLNSISEQYPNDIQLSSKPIVTPYRK